MRKAKNFLRKGIYGAAFTAFATTGIVCSEYADVMGFSKDFQAGRTKNALSSVVAGVVGQKMHGESDIDLEIRKQFFPDARVTGKTTPTSVDTFIDLALTSVHFKANGSRENLKGEVEKSEFNWKVKQKSNEIFEVNRFGPKFDAYLDIDVNNGRINGEYVRPGFHFDWAINGTYDPQGNVRMRIDGPLCLGLELVGTITSK